VLQLNECSVGLYCAAIVLSKDRNNLNFELHVDFILIQCSQTVHSLDSCVNKVHLPNISIVFSRHLSCRVFCMHYQH